MGLYSARTGGDVAGVLAIIPLAKRKIHPFSPLRKLTCIQFGAASQQAFGTTSMELMPEVTVIIASFSEMQMS
jgi:hypothetical protein